MKFAWLAWWLVVTATACKFDPPGQPADRIDAPAGDGIMRDTPSGGDDRHLLITEIAPLDMTEFIEIYNPTPSTVDLSSYHLSDVNDYWQLAGHVAGSVGSTIVLLDSDFVVKFPPGATLAPGAVAVIAINGPIFQAAFGVLPNFTILVPVVGSASMVEVVPNPTPQNTLLTDAAEMVVLFTWDGASDLVRDVDLVVAGKAPSAANAPAAKLTVDGPDADLIATPYGTDADTIADMVKDAASTESYKRITLEGVFETRAGTGNGITGHDETSEQQTMTWDSGSSPETPGVIPAELR